MSKKQRTMTSAEAMAKAGWAHRTLAERLAYLARIIIPHPQFSHAIAEVARRIERVQAQQKGAALCIVAPTGAGKTTLANRICATFPDEELDDLTIRRAVYFSVPPRPSSSSMSSAVLNALGDPRWNMGRTDVLANRATLLLRECKTAVVLIDNIHDVPERRKAKGVREVGNWVRDLIDAVPALFVSLGAEQGLDVFKANSQSRRRSPATIRIDYFDCRTTQGVARLRRFLLELDIKLPLAELSGLERFDLTQRIWMATNGIPDYIINLLTEAITVAATNGREQLQLDDFEKAFHKNFEDATPELNPFLSDARIRVLDQPGEPFEDWLNDGYL